MEFVAGGTLDHWLSERPRAPEEILAAFVQAGRGLAAAHAAGLVHRDFKPSNVLVGEDGRVLVTDFGLARPVSVDGLEAPSGPSTERTSLLPLTRTGRVAGTPAYMAPEQLLGGAVDARADQFSFCVALWSGLYGTPPHDGRTLESLVAARTAGLISPPAPAAVAAIPARVREALERGLDPTPAGRFARMDDLLEVLADRPRTGSGRARVIVAAVGVAAAIGAALWLGAKLTGGMASVDPCASREDRFARVWDEEAQRAVRAAFAATGKSYAEASFREVARQLGRQRLAWDRMRRDSCEATRLRREQSDQMLDIRAACLDRRLADVSAFVAELREADAALVGRAAQEASSIGDPGSCGDVEALARRAPLSAAAGRRAAIEAVEGELSTLRGQVAAGRARDAAPRVDSVVARARAIGYPPLLAQTFALAGEIETQLEHGDRAAAHYRDALLAAEAGGDDELRFRCEAALVIVFGQLLERDADGVRHAEQARALLARLGPDPRRTALLARNEADADWLNGRYDEGRRRAQEAIDLYEKLDPAGPELIRALHRRAVLEQELGANAAALATEARALALAERAMGADHPMVGQILNTTSGPLRRLGRHEEARAALRRAIRIFEAAEGPESANVARALGNLATIDFDDERYDEAIAGFRRVLAMFIAASGPDNTRVALTYEKLGNALSVAGRAREAEEAFGRAIAIHTARVGKDSSPTATSRRRLGEHYLRTGRPALARSTFLESLHSIEVTEGPTSPLVARHLLWLGQAEAQLGRPAAAAAAYRRALALPANPAGDNPGLREEIEAALEQVSGAGKTRR